jgi:hypothetical protein
MRKLKLQMQMTVDGLVAGPEGQLAWMTMEAGDERLIGFNQSPGRHQRHDPDGAEDDRGIRLKRESGKDLLVYGGASFVSSLIEAGLIDELHFFVNPVAIGNGMRVFQGETRLELAGSTAYPSGIVVNSYRPRP